MSKQIIEQFYVVGISLRTTNENGQSAKDIEILWGKFWGENIPSQISNKVSDDIYAVYTNYETDHTGPYTAVIGYAVHFLDYIPEGMVGIFIGTTMYEKYISKGKMPDAVLNTWLEIWADQKLSERRRYKADFTIHSEKYHDGENAEVENFISVK